MDAGRNQLGAQEPSDGELMGLYQGGDVDAFGVLFERHRKPLFTFLVHRTGDAQAAEDLFQEVFLKVVHAKRQYEVSRSFRAWLFTIARNAVTDRYRKEGVREAEVLENAMGDETSSNELDQLGQRQSPMDPEGSLGTKDLQRYVEGALGKLPVEQREVFLLRERAKLDYERIAELTGCKIATAKSRMRYALVALRRHLQDAGFGEQQAAGGTHE